MDSSPPRRRRARVGCSGWDYPDWGEVLYPAGLPRRRRLERYASLFDTVELNSTFYRLPAEPTVLAWAAAVPPGFVFSVKLGQFGSHRKKLRDPATWLPHHVERLELLGEHLGPTLVQLPPHWHRDTERLDAFLEAAPRRLRWAVELRDPTWLHDDVFEVLQRHGAALCIHDLLPDHPWELTTDWTYVRFHGPRAGAERYAGEYTGQRLWRAATRFEEWLDRGHDVYAYFNNDRDGAALHDAAWLRKRLEGPGPA